MKVVLFDSNTKNQCFEKITFGMEHPGLEGAYGEKKILRKTLVSEF